VRFYCVFFILQIDLNIPLEDQGPFDIILQKITDYMAKARNGDEHALKTIKSLEVSVQYILSVEYLLGSMGGVAV
jgi:hypothetical protein